MQVLKIPQRQYNADKVKINFQEFMLVIQYSYHLKFGLCLLREKI